MSVLLIAVTSYLLGSIPFGYILVRVFRGEDVRQSGSGNIGATNVSRRSPALGALTLVLDALKGSAAVWLAYWLSGRMRGASPSSVSLAAFSAVAGHMFPLWLGFRGGKGVATGLGAFAMIAPKPVLVSAAIFAVAVLLFRYVSLGSVVAVAAFPLVVFEMHGYGGYRLALAFMIATSLLIILRHHENLRRLVAGTESRLGAARK